MIENTETHLIIIIKDVILKTSIERKIMKHTFIVSGVIKRK